MLSFRSREEYKKWKESRSKKEAPPSETQSGTRCSECGNEIDDSDNFCPNCGLSIRDQSDESGGASQFKKISHKVFLRIKKEVSPGVIYYRVKRLARATIICFIAYTLISLVWGGKPFRKLDEGIYGLFTDAAEKMQDSGHESLNGILVSSRDEICSLVDYLACESDQLGIVDQYVSSKKKEREREGEHIADDLKMLKKLQEEDPGQQ